MQISSEAPFEMELNPTVGSTIPSNVMTRVRGKQCPVVPHAQRLLVAATKEAKAEKGKGKGKKGKGKGKGGGGGKHKPKPKTKGKPKSKPVKPVESEPKPKTAYADAKSVYMEQFRVQILRWMFVITCST